MVSPQVVRRWIITGSVAAITATGAIYGAQLKGAQEIKKVCRFICNTIPRGFRLLVAVNGH